MKERAISLARRVRAQADDTILFVREHPGEVVLAAYAAFVFGAAIQQARKETIPMLRAEVSPWREISKDAVGARSGSGS